MCKFCCGDIVLYQQVRNTKLEINTKGEARALYTEVEDYQDIVHRAAFIINYCPNCGRRLGEITAPECIKED